MVETWRETFPTGKYVSNPRILRCDCQRWPAFEYENSRPASCRPTPLGNNICILVFKVAEGLLVGRGYVFSRREDCEAEND